MGDKKLKVVYKKKRYLIGYCTHCFTNLKLKTCLRCDQ